MAPLRLAFPATLIWSKVTAPVALVRPAICSTSVAPEASVRSPVVVSTPGELPGDTAAPASAVTAPVVPLPPSTAPEPTSTGELAMEPFTSSVPELTVVAPV